MDKIWLGKGTLNNQRTILLRNELVMNMAEFNIILYGPCSTTKEKAVAARFGGHDGFLIQFDNSSGKGTKVKGFDVSWLSRYGLQEDERYKQYILIPLLYISYVPSHIELYRLFIHCAKPLNVSSIILQSTSSNLGPSLDL